MKIEVEIKRADQSWDMRTRQQQNYLVLEVLGVEVRAPCTEEQLIAVISTIGGAEYDSDEEPEAQAPHVSHVPATFVQEEDDELPFSEPATPEPAPRKLTPLERPRGDDVGIAQG